MIYVATGINEAYYPKAQRFIRSLEREAGPVKPFIITVGWNGLKELPSVELPLDKIKAPNGNFCVQHGAFTEVLPADDDDMVIFSDADCEMWRPLEDDEITYINSFTHNQIGLSYNAFEGETLSNELELLEARWPDDLPYIDASQYATGFMIARFGLYKSIYRRYVELWPSVASISHYAKQQFLICYCVHTMGIEVKVIPPELYYHAVYFSPDAHSVPCFINDEGREDFDL